MFDRVIQEVCDGSQVDFEESGVDQQTLLDLRKVSAPSTSIFLCWRDLFEVKRSRYAWGGESPRGRRPKRGPRGAGRAAAWGHRLLLSLFLYRAAFTRPSRPAKPLQHRHSLPVSPSPLGLRLPYTYRLTLWLLAPFIYFF